MDDIGTATCNRTAIAESPVVRHFRQILFWPLQVMPADSNATASSRYWDLFDMRHPESRWREVDKTFGDHPDAFRERYYKEFVTFLPYVQRFLYGEAPGEDTTTGYGLSPIRVFRRDDVAYVRMTFDERTPPVTFSVETVDLYFFYDIDIAILFVEIAADDLPLPLAQQALFSFGRAYPAFWDERDQPGQCLQSVEWLATDGRSLSTSDYGDREKYLSFFSRHHTPVIARHWEFLLRPMSLYHSGLPGVLRYRQIEYHRMPLMAYLAFDEPRELTRGDFVRLALITKPGDSRTLPYAASSLADFEKHYCYDRFWEPSVNPGPLNSRYLCCGHALVIVGKAGDAFFVDGDTGMLGQFRHQYFLMGMIAHFHKAALHLFSERLVSAISQLDTNRRESVRRFKRDIRHIMGAFLRFTHRYWFHEVSNQAQARDLFNLMTGHLGTDRLYGDINEAVREMAKFLEADDLRRQSETVTRLTVVTTLSIIGTVATGFLGMNLIDAADQPLWVKAIYFSVVLLVFALIVFFTVSKSTALSESLDVVANERASAESKLIALMRALNSRLPRR